MHTEVNETYLVLPSRNSELKVWGEVEHSEAAQGRGILERPLRERGQLPGGPREWGEYQWGKAAQGQETMAGVLGWFG